MKKILIILITFFICLHFSYASNIDLDSARLGIRIERALEIIKKDSLFQTYMEKEFGNLQSFFVKDTLYCPFVTFSLVKKLYPCTSNWFIFSTYCFYQECYKQKIEKKSFLKLHSKYKSTLSNYNISIGIMDLNFLNFFITPKNPKTKSKAMEIFIEYDANLEVIQSYSETYFASE